MNTTILILIATMLVTVLSFYTVFKTKFTFNVYVPNFDASMLLIVGAISVLVKPFGPVHEYVP